MFGNKIVLFVLFVTLLGEVNAGLGDVAAGVIIGGAIAGNNTTHHKEREKSSPTDGEDFSDLPLQLSKTIKIDVSKYSGDIEISSIPRTIKTENGSIYRLDRRVIAVYRGNNKLTEDPYYFVKSVSLSCSYGILVEVRLTYHLSGC